MGFERFSERLAERVREPVCHGDLAADHIHDHPPIAEETLDAISERRGPVFLVKEMPQPRGPIAHGQQDLDPLPRAADGKQREGCYHGATPHKMT